MAGKCCKNESDKIQMTVLVGGGSFDESYATFVYVSCEFNTRFVRRAHTNKLNAV